MVQKEGGREQYFIVKIDTRDSPFSYLTFVDFPEWIFLHLPFTFRGISRDCVLRGILLVLVLIFRRWGDVFLSKFH